MNQADKPFGSLNVAKLQSFCKQAEEAYGGAISPPMVDHRAAANPYHSRWGEDEGEKKLKGCKALKSFACITDLILHMIEETDRVTMGTKWEGKGLIYHDALVLMTAGDTIQWMKDQNILHRWILPLEGLMEDDPELASYFGRPPGDSPEFMPLDNCLNQDLHQGCSRMVRFTRDLAKDDPKKFSLATPVLGANAYKRIWNPVVLEGEDPDDCGAPNSARIVQDCALFPLALMATYNAQGCITDFAKRRGKRELTAEDRQNMPTTRKWGGARQKKGPSEGRWVHPDARDALWASGAGDDEDDVGFPDGVPEGVVGPQEAMMIDEALTPPCHQGQLVMDH